MGTILLIIMLLALVGAIWASTREDKQDDNDH